MRKAWVDVAGGIYNSRPASITVQLQRRYHANGTWENVEGQTLELKPDQWQGSFTGLLSGDRSGIIQYRAVETSAPEGYTQSGEPALGTDESGQTCVITNTLTDTTQLTVNKVWEDENNAYHKRPQAVTLQLQQRTGENAWRNVGATVAIGPDNWMHTYAGLPAKNAGGVALPAR